MSTEHPHRKLLFHIGHHKTGSTTIQDAFATGRVHLEGQRILYPGRMAHNYLARHFDVYANAGKILPDRPGFPGLEEISRRLQLGNFDVAVISAEEFEGADPALVQKVLQDFMLPHVTDHAVICYVRPHAARLLSSFAEQVKLGLFAATPDAFFEKAIKNGRFFYARRLPLWAKVFQGHFRLRPMIRAQLAGGSVLEDFVQTGFDPGAPVRIDPMPAANESLCLEDLLLVRLVQDCLASRDLKLRHAMGWEIAPAFAAVARPQGPGTKLALHKALAERIRAAYRDDAREIDTLFFEGKTLLRDELDRAVDEALPTAQSFEPSDHFSADTLRTVSVLGAEINRLLDHEGGPWPRFLLERRIAAVHEEKAKSIGAKKTVPLIKTRVPAKEKDGIVERRGQGAEIGDALNLQKVERIIGKIHDTQTREHASRQLGNLLMKTPIHSVQLTARDFVNWLDKRKFNSDLLYILEEFLLQLFFYDFLKDILENQRNLSISELSAGRGPLAEVLRRLLAAHDSIAETTKASIHYVRMDIVPAYEAFDAARRALVTGGQVHHHNRGLLSLRPMHLLSDWASKGTVPDLPDVTFESDKGFNDDLPLVVVGMDGNYYKRYADRLANTGEGRVNLHFHVANPEGIDLISAGHIRHSVETAPSATSAYYATMRFLRLPLFLKKYHCPIVTVDADAFFIGSTRPLIEKLANHDILLNAASGLNHPRRHLVAVPWRHITAQILVAAPSPRALEFLETFSRLYAGLTLGNTAPSWWIDQALLSETTDVCRYEQRKIRIKTQWLHTDSGIRQGKL